MTEHERSVEAVVKATIKKFTPIIRREAERAVREALERGESVLTPVNGRKSA